MSLIMAVHVTTGMGWLHGRQHVPVVPIKICAARAVMRCKFVAQQRNGGLLKSQMRCSVRPLLEGKTGVGERGRREGAIAQS